MNEKTINQFMQHLEEEKLSLINPRALTAKEMVLFGKMRGFNFSTDDLREKMDEINNTSNDELGNVAKIWKDSNIANKTKKI